MRLTIMNDRLKRIISNPGIVFLGLGGRGFFKWMSDRAYLKIAYRLNLHEKLNLDNPEGYNAKLQWMKLYDRRPEYVRMVDKYEAKKFVAQIIGDQYIVPTIGVWDGFDDIDFEKLPDQFVLKCTHDSGGLVICKDKRKFNKGEAKKKIESCLKKSYYWQGREWPYKKVKPRIIAEAYMEDSVTHDLRDYKFFAFDGVVRALFIATERQTEGEDTKFDFFDANFNHLKLIHGHANADTPPAKPLKYDEMLKLAAALSKGYPQLRVDFYEVNGRVYFGELTLFHHGGLVPFKPKKWDKVFGNWIKLPNCK